ncbi:MAG TPA: VWA domain-containing protein [Polyangiaceae bacterium]|nr:VWA domain-containing protein [Polyangiaceae bacterium]
MRFRKPFLGLLGLSLLVSGCVTARQAPLAERGQRSDAPAAVASAAPHDVAPMPEEAVTRDEAKAEEAPLVEPPPPPVAAAEKKKVELNGPRASAPAPAKPASKSASGGLGLSGVGVGGGGVGYGSGMGRLGGAHAAQGRVTVSGRSALAPAPTAAPIERDAEMNTENYAHVTENPFLAVASQPLSTFSIDVDTASYSNSRRFLADGTLPPKDAIRIEEWVNYFSYDYAQPTGDRPFSVSTEVTSCPWNSAHQLVRIGIKGREIREENVPARNLVFLLDVSGSMMSPDKLPLVKRGLAMMTDQLRPQDSVAIVVYAGNSGLVLPATSGRERGKILKALDSLEAGGSTNGGEGIRLAYSVAQQQFKKGGINRVILATDGDFNVGTTSEGELTRLIEDKRKSGVFLTVLGFGTGNTKDSTMEMLADKGNGNYAYVDTLTEGRKVLVREAGSTLVTIAKDVKLQVEMNPLKVQSYKLIGYENRLLAKEDFNDDKKDAGEIGAGHSVTALYEIVPKGAPAPATPGVDPLKYQSPGAPSAAATSGELMTVSVRYKPPQGDVSTKFSVVVNNTSKPIDQASDDYRFGVAVANVALVLRGSPDVKQSSLDSARALAAGAIGPDLHGDRREFLAMIDQAKRLRGGGAQTALKTVAR